ncbi:lipocalin family protein [Nocardia sp. NBC_01503]|uniref:lipocalin family protein n=1 Tax=Nocardia sp. NBC_01503 TaxID=2975997 RepID=UPI002E7B0E08|nr:lipocalin family protein [Nocardia sp. NBC_01503]WTL31530.1 lipocalin family protein [Nocardia sp. NBC_01503]
MNRNRMRTALAALAVAAASWAPVAGIGAPATAQADPPAPIADLDLTRYLGTWYQLAAVPQYFNLVCARDTRAEYTLDQQGDVAVHNSCTTWSGGPNDIRGTATVTDPVTRAQLHVSFPGVPTQDMRYGPTNYIVTALGDDYAWALVTDPNRLSGFVLSRTPALDAAQWRDIRAAVTAAGEDPCWYLTTPATGGLDRIAPLCVA